MEKQKDILVQVGIAGSLANKSKIIECYNSATIIQSDTGNDINIGYVGGITSGNNQESQISYCYNTGEVRSTRDWLGGITSSVTKGSKVNNCYNKGKVIRESIHDVDHLITVGGIASNTHYDSSYGAKICLIKNCYNIEEISCENSLRNIRIGGIIGTIQSGYANLDNNYNKANVSATSSGARVGGIIGDILNNPQITVTNCKTIMVTQY